MRIAVASEGLNVAPNFASTISFMCYTVKCGIITECQNMPNPQLPLEQLLALFNELEVGALIVNQIEYDIARIFCNAGIEVVAGAQGSAMEVARAYLSKTLTGIENVCHLGNAETTSPAYA